MKSAALIVIGDEILTGKIKDENSFVFTKAMFDRGIRVGRIVVIPDDVKVIGDFVLEYSRSFDYVFTSGGVGPTHDDKTFDGIALGLSLPLKEHHEALQYFQHQQRQAGRGEIVTDTQRKMLRFPSPCQVHFVKPLWLPLVAVNNVYVLPGVPYLFEKLLTGLVHLFEGSSFFREIIVTDQSENAIAIDLKDVQDRYPDVAIGSYPQMPGKPFNVMVTIDGTDDEQVKTVAKKLLPKIYGRRLS